LGNKTGRKDLIYRYNSKYMRVLLSKFANKVKMKFTKGNEYE